MARLVICSAEPAVRKERFGKLMLPSYVPCSFPVLTVSLAGSRPVIWTEPSLHLPLAQLELLGVGEQRPAGVPESLFLP